MKDGKAVRVALDVVLTLMIVFEMLIQFTGDFLHEVVGTAFFVTVIAHIALSASWVKKTAQNAKRGRLTPRRMVLATVGILLAITTIVLAISSIAISNILYSAGFTWPIGSYALWATVHSVSAYALCALVVVHLATHWAFLASAFKVPYNPARRRAISTGVNAVAALGVVALGVTAARTSLPQTVAGGSSDGSSNAQGSSTEAVGASTREGAGRVSASDATAGNGAQGAAGNSDESGSSQTPTSGQGAESASSGKRGKHSRQSSGSYSDSSDASSLGSESGSRGSSGATSQNGSSSSAPGTSTGSAGESSPSASVSGICNLCRKQCPLSSPKCDKPYQAGLL